MWLTCPSMRYFLHLHRTGKYSILSHGEGVTCVRSRSLIRNHSNYGWSKVEGKKRNQFQKASYIIFVLSLNTRVQSLTLVQKNPVLQFLPTVNHWPFNRLFYTFDIYLHHFFCTVFSHLRLPSWQKVWESKIFWEPT